MKKIQSAILIVLMLSSTLTVLSSSFSLVHGASNALWCNILYGGLKYDVYVSSDPQISDPHDRALSFVTDASAITNIYAMENAGPIVVDAKLKQLLVLDAQNLGRFTKNIDSADDMSALSLSDFSEETRNDYDNNQYLIAPPSATTDFFKSKFIYKSWLLPFKIDGTDDYDHRVDMWKEVILDSVLQADLYKTNHLDPQLVEQLSRVLHGLGLSLTISEMILKGSHTFSLKPTEVQTTLFNYQEVALRASMLKNLGKLSAILGAFTAGVDVYADVMQMLILGSLANAAAEERLSALEDFVQQNEGSLDVALVSGIVKAREGFDEIIKTYYDGVQNLMRSVQKNAISIALAVASLAASFSSSALSSFLLPFALDYAMYSHLKDQTYKMQRLSLAAALQRILSTKPSLKGLSFLRDELKNTEYKDHDRLDTALNLFCVDNYLGFYFYKNYYETLNVPIYKQIENWWTGGVLDEALNYYSSRATTQSQIVTWVQPDAFMAKWPERNWDDISWLLQKASLQLPFHVTAESTKQWYKIGDTTTTTITVTNCRNVATAYWITVRLMDSRENPTMYIPTSVDPTTITLDPGKSTQHVVQWKIPESAPQVSYRMSVDLWTDVNHKEEYLDDMGWKTVFNAYKLVILTPTTERPVYVDTTMTSGSILVAAYLDAPFLPYSSFDIDIGGKNAEFKQALTFIQDPFYWLELLGIYTFQVTPPTQETQGPFGLNIAVNYNEIVDSAAQTNAVIYQESLGPIEKGLAWLRAQQYGDGSWLGNVGVTGLCTLAFLNSGYDETDTTVSKAISYVLSKVHSDGSIYTSYSVYETSTAILPLVATHNANYATIIENAKNWLVGAQQDETFGYTPTNYQYGGWTYSSGRGDPDLSNTQFALLALDAANLPKTDPTWSKAIIFTQRCQNRPASNDQAWAHVTTQPSYNDGGFIYRPWGWSLAGGTLSYGSMTGAGIWGLLLSGVPKTDERVVAALDWVTNHYTWDNNPVYGSRPYYYYLSMSKALTMYGKPVINGHDWYQELYDKIVGMQINAGSGKGYWSTSAEDYNPVLTTGYAILSLQTKAVALPGQRLSYLTFILRSNCLIRILDPEGNLVGYNYTTGLGENQISTAVYSGPFSEPQYVVIVNPKPGAYKLELVGISEGSYQLTIQGNYGEEVTDTFEYTGYIKPAEIHGSDVTVTAIVGPLDIYTNHPVLEKIIARARFEYDTLNLKSRGDWVTAYVELPEGYDVNNIDVSTIRLNETIPAETDPVAFGDYDNDGIPDLAVRFNRTLLVEYLISKGIASGNVTLAITGLSALVKMEHIQPVVTVAFEGSSSIKVSSLVGDVNCDGTVDVFDAVGLLASYGSREGYANWNPNANFAEEWDRINLYDAITLIYHYGQTMP